LDEAHPIVLRGLNDGAGSIHLHLNSAQRRDTYPEYYGLEIFCSAVIEVDVIMKEEPNAGEPISRRQSREYTVELRTRAAVDVDVGKGGKEVEVKVFHGGI
jgi:hypothetical protein